MNHNPKDILMGILYFNDYTSFNATLEVLHYALFELNENEPLLNCFLFNEKDKRLPHSEKLQNALINLVHSGFLQANAPYLSDYYTYHIPLSLRGYFDQSIKYKFSTKELKKIQSLSEKFFKALESQTK